MTYFYFSLVPETKTPPFLLVLYQTLAREMKTLKRGGGTGRVSIGSCLILGCTLAVSAKCDRCVLSP